MKLLTLNFLTCAVKDCKAAATATTTFSTTTSTHLPSTRETQDPDNDEDAPRGPPFPLAITAATLETTSLDFQPLFWRNIIPRIEWDAMAQVVSSVGLKLPEAIMNTLLSFDNPSPSPSPSSAPAPVVAAATAAGPNEKDEEMQDIETTLPTATTTTATTTIATPDGPDGDFDDETLKKLHNLLLETQVVEGALVCRRCGHSYAVKEGIANFLLPPHLV